MIEFELTHPEATREHLGLIPDFLRAADPRPAREQFDERYRHGGGWRPIPNWTVLDGAIQYSDDPPHLLLAVGRLRDETIRIYDGAWVSITGPDGAVEIARMD